jgi:hypothetical protein
LEASNSTYIGALVILADHKESLQKLLEPQILAQALTQKVFHFPRPKTKRYRLLVLYQLVDQPEQCHFEDLFHFLEQLRLPFNPDKYLFAA